MTGFTHLIGRLAAVWSRSRALRVAAVVMVLAGLFAVPRLLALRGVSRTVHLRFMDMLYHLSKLDVMHKRRSLDPALLQDPYFQHYPDRLRPYENIRWPRGVYDIGLLWVGIFGPQSIWTVQLTNLPFTILLALGVVGLGKAMGDTRLGVWAAALTMLCPALVAHSWYFSLDYPLVAMVTVGLLLLWQTRGFTGLRPSLAFGIWSSLGSTIKTTYGLYLLVPSVAALVVGLRRPGEAGRARVAAHVAFATLLTVVLAFLVNGWSLGLLWRELWVHLAGKLDPTHFQFKLVAPWTLRWFGAMAFFAVANFPWPLLALATPGLVLAHTRRPLTGRWLWLSFFWGTYVVLTLIANKMERYLQPVYPLICLLSVWWVFTLVPRRWRTTALLWIATAYAAVLYLAHVHPTPWFPDRESATTERYMHEIGMPGRATLDGLRRHTYHPRCDLGSLIDDVEAFARRSRRPLAVAVRGDLPLTALDLELPVAQRLKHHFVYHHDAPNNTPLELHICAAPSVIVLHPRSEEFGWQCPDIVAVDRHDVTVRCGQEAVLARLTLYRHVTEP